MNDFGAGDSTDKNVANRMNQLLWAERLGDIAVTTDVERLHANMISSKSNAGCKTAADGRTGVAEENVETS